MINLRGKCGVIRQFCVAGTDNGSSAVICREHVRPVKYSAFKKHAVSICSRPCDDEVGCLVSQAARATSAAPTFFPAQRIGNRLFADGGVLHNNPSYAIYAHYEEADKLAKNAQPPRSLGHHQIDFSKVRIVNIGTGTTTDELLLSREGSSAGYIPEFIRSAKFLKRILVEAAADAENVVGQMESLAHASQKGGKIKYERFSADNELCFIKLDKYRAIDKIEELTQDYLSKTQVQVKLQSLAKELAEEYLENRRFAMRATPVPLHNHAADGPNVTSPTKNPIHQVASSSDDAITQMPSPQNLNTSAQRAKSVSTDDDSKTSIDETSEPPTLAAQKHVRHIPFRMDTGRLTENVFLTRSDTAPLAKSISV